MSSFSVQTRVFYIHIFSLNMKVANNLVVIVIIKQHTRLFYRHTFSVNMNVVT